MKKILLYILLLISTATTAQVKIGADGAMHPTGNYPATQMDEVQAFALTYQTLAQRNAIPANYRDTGMIVLVRDSSAIYTLVGGITNSDWVKISMAGSGGISEVVATNGLTNVNDSTVKWGGFLTENTHIRGDNFLVNIDSVSSFAVRSYPISRSSLFLDTSLVTIVGKGSSNTNGTLQLNPNSTPVFGGSTLGVAKLFATTGSIAQAIEVNPSVISFYRTPNHPAKIYNRNIGDSLGVDSVTTIAVWDSDTLKSADVSLIGGNQDLQSVLDEGATANNQSITLTDDDDYYALLNPAEGLYMEHTDGRNAQFTYNGFGATDATGKYTFGTTDAGMRPVPMTTAERDAITAFQGQMIWNTTVDSLQVNIDPDTGEFTWINLGGSGGGTATTPAGNYGNLQLNRNSVFATPASDSLSFASGVLTNLGSSVTKGTVTITTTATGTAGTDSVLVQSGGVVKKISPAFYTDVVSGAATQVPYFSGASTLTSNADFNYTSSILNLVRSSIGAITTTNGFTLKNPTAATASVFQYSPRLYLEGYGWNTNATQLGSQPLGFSIGVEPVSGNTGAAYANGTLAFRSNSGSVFTVNQVGGITAPAQSTFNGGIVSTQFIQGSTVIAAAQINAPANSSPITYRLTDGGTVLTPPLEIANGNTPTHILAFDKANGLTMGMRNSNGVTATNIATSALQLTNITVTAGAETSDLSFYTKPTGSAIVERMKITGTGVVTFLTPMGTSGSTPANTPGTGAGTSPTISVTGNDAAGYVTIATGTSPTASGNIVTVTFSTALVNTPKSIQLTPANEAAATELVKFYVDQATVSTSAWIIKNTAVGLTASTTYKFYYTVIQ